MKFWQKPWVRGVVAILVVGVGLWLISAFGIVVLPKWVADNLLWLGITIPIAIALLAGWKDILELFEPKNDVQLPQDLKQPYLEWVSDYLGKINLLGSNERSNVSISLPIADAFVPLAAATQRPRQEKGNPLGMGDSAHQILLNEVLTLGNRIVITGGPGSGKTTVLSYIGWVLAKALLDQKPVFAQKNVGVTTPLPIPVYLPLSRYAAHVKACRLEKSSGIRPTISQYIPHYLEEMEVTLGDNFNFFQELLDKKTKILLLLDGLDEVPNKDDRALVT